MGVRTSKHNTCQLIDAVNAGNMSDIKALLNSGTVDVNEQDSYGWTALHYASLRGQNKVVHLLIEHGANVRIMDNYGETAYSNAVHHGHAYIARLTKSKTIYTPITHTHDTPSSSYAVCSYTHSNSERYDLLFTDSARCEN